jgi:tRNA(Ile)-lysidine synthase
MRASRNLPETARYNQTVLGRVAEIITRYSMFQLGARVGVAVSGGADSMCLLHVLTELSPRWNLQLAVLHLNHNLRGEESDADEEFVRETARRLGLPALVERWERGPAPESQSNAGESAPAGEQASRNLEEAARDARLAFFRRAIESGAVECVALGHTKSDQAETVLFRFLRGSGTAGLAGVRPVTSTGLVRPLLEISRPEIEAFLRERGIKWREDSTNQTLSFARNRIRHQLLPELARDWNPAISETLANFATWAQGEEDYWAAELDRLEHDLVNNSAAAPIIEVAALKALPLAVARRLTRRLIERAKGDLRGIDFRHVGAILDLAFSPEGHGRLQAPGLDVYRSFEWLRFGRPGTETLENRNYRLPAPVPGVLDVPAAGLEIRLELIEKTDKWDAEACVYNGQMGCIDWRRVSGSLELRNWRPGDQYQPIGSSGEQKIKTLFQEARVPLWERRHWPVLADGDSIVWSQRFGPATRYAAGPDSKVILVVSAGRR